MSSGTFMVAEALEATMMVRCKERVPLLGGFESLSWVASRASATQERYKIRYCPANVFGNHHGG